MCHLNPNQLKDPNPFAFIRFIIASTLIVTAIAFLILSPIIIYLVLLSFFPTPIGLGIFLVLILGLPTFFAIVVNYLKKNDEK